MRNLFFDKSNLAVFLMLIALGVSGNAQSNADWVRARGGVIPSDAVLGGYEDNGRKTFVCRARFGGSYVSGKALDDRCYYNSGSRERSVTRFDILVGGGFLWRRTRNRDRAVISGGTSEENHYVCRVTVSGGQYAGSLQNGRCYYTRNNRGYSRTRYEILQGSGRSNTLLSAASRGDYLSVREALRDGQAINQKDNSGKTALMLASEKGYSRVVRDLLWEGASPDLVDKKGNTAFMFAAHRGHSEILEELVSKGANTSLRNNEGDTAFTLVASGGHPQLVRLFLQSRNYGGDDDPDTEHAFRNAAQFGHPDVLRVLLEFGISVESTDINGRTALMLASLSKRVETVRFLLENDASINARDDRDWTPFLYGVDSNSAKVLGIFVDEYIKNDEYEAQEGLRLAARNDRRNSLKYLIQKGVDPDSQNRATGFTPLMFSASEGHEKATRELVKANANLNLQGKLGETALMLAAANSKRNTAKVLIKAGADLDLRDNSGITALGWAIQNKHKDTRKELQKAGAKQ